MLQQRIRRVVFFAAAAAVNIIHKALGHRKYININIYIYI